MTQSRNKREGWYHLRIQGEFFRTFKKRYAIRYNLKPGTQAYRDAIIEECKDMRNREVACFGRVEITPGMMRDYILNDDIKKMYPGTIRNPFEEKKES